jgi:hypothetical protein
MGLGEQPDQAREFYERWLARGVRPSSSCWRMLVHS